MGLKMEESCSEQKPVNVVARFRPISSKKNTGPVPASILLVKALTWPSRARRSSTCEFCSECDRIAGNGQAIPGAKQKASRHLSRLKKDDSSSFLLDSICSSLSKRSPIHPLFLKRKVLAVNWRQRSARNLRKFQST